jgi:hypothetical protein
VPQFAMTTVHIAAGDLHLSGHANQVELTASQDERDVTTFGSNGWRQKIGGLATTMVNVSGWQDFTAPGADPSFPATGTLTDGSLTPWTVSVPGSTVGDVAYFGQAIRTNIVPLTGAVGDVGGFSIDFAGTGRPVRGQMAAIVASRVATGNGTTFALTGPAAGQSLYAAFFLHSVTGTPGTVQFSVQTDDNSGMTTPTTRITSTAFAAIGAQFASVAGPFSGETHIRVNHTLTTFTAATFSVVVGIAAT